VSAVTFVSVLGHTCSQNRSLRGSLKETWDRPTLKLQQFRSIAGDDLCLSSHRAVTNVTAIRLRSLK
jgi:hypothetical protein